LFSAQNQCFKVCDFGMSVDESSISGYYKGGTSKYQSNKFKDKQFMNDYNKTSFSHKSKISDLFALGRIIEDLLFINK